MPLELKLGDLVITRKPHPCGGNEWKVVRLGADIGLVCQTCQHRILLSRRDLEHKMKKLVPCEPQSVESGLDSMTDEKIHDERS